MRSEKPRVISYSSIYQVRAAFISRGRNSQVVCSHFDALNTKKVLLILSFQLRSFELGSFTKLVKIKMVLLYCIVDFIHCHAMFSGLTSDNDVGYLTSLS